MFLRCYFDDANVRLVSSIKQIGFRYGSLVEDFHTGYRLHCEGWKSVFCDPARPAFLGDGPKNLNDVLSQCKRWCVGLYEVAFSRFNPLTFGITKASFSMGLIYAHYACWGTWCVPITVYGLLPPLALMYRTPFFPKALSLSLSLSLRHGDVFNCWSCSRSPIHGSSCTPTSSPQPMAKTSSCSSQMVRPSGGGGVTRGCG